MTPRAGTVGEGLRVDGEVLGDEAFDRYARMVRRALGVPVALVSLVESDRQVFPGAVGLSEELMVVRQTPLSHSFCQYVVQDSAPLVVPDARLDPRVQDNLAIPDLGVSAYAGWPLTDVDGATIGSLCAIDGEVREWSQDDLDALADLAAVCSAELIARAGRQAADGRALAARHSSMQSRLLLSLSEGLAHTRTLADVAAAVERAAHDALGCLHAGIWLREVSNPGLVAAPVPPVRGRAEQLTHVPSAGVDWPSADRHATVDVAEDNPLGAVVLHGRALFWTSRAEQDDRYPELVAASQTGEARAIVPLSDGDQVYGAIVLLWPDTREFSRDDRRAITAMAAYTSQAVHRALLLQERVDVAVALQDAMLTELPAPEHLLLEARYRPAGPREQVGGDWYDAFVLPDGDTCVMVGDVMGHDITAAGVMGQLRNMLRAFAWGHTDRPSRTVLRLDEACAHLAPEVMATLLYGRIEHRPGQDGPAHRLHWTNAGHLPPVLVGADGVVSVLEHETRTDALLGLAENLPRHDSSAALPPGSTLLLYTDGLVERRGEHLLVSIDRLCGEATRLVGGSLDELLDGLIDALVGDHPADDVVVLAVRVPA